VAATPSHAGGIARVKAASINPSSSSFAAFCPPACGWPQNQPNAPAARMISGKGIAKTNIATNAEAATHTSARPLSARFAIRTTASSTIASTAAFKPKNSDATTPIWPKAAYSQLSTPRLTSPGRMKSVPDTMPPRMRCISQPI
jgi:hypothetical protein